MGVAVGSSVQVAVFVIPFMVRRLPFDCKRRYIRTNTVAAAVAVTVTVTVAQVVMAWMFDVPLTLDFQPFETATVFLAVIIVNVIMANGKSTYLDGLMLLSLYFFISLGFIMHDPEEAHCIQDQLWYVLV